MLTMNDEFSLFDFVMGISEVIDLISPEMNNHHKRVAYISYKIALEMGLKNEEIGDIVFAATLHDIGAFSTSERLAIIRNKEGIESFDKNQHAYAGYMLLRNFKPLLASAEIIRYHHAEYNSNQPHIPRGSYIVSLADTIAIMIDDKIEILEQTDVIIEKIKLLPFPEEIVEAFLAFSKFEYFWIELCSLSAGSFLCLRSLITQKIMGIDNLLDFSKVVSYIIDFRCHFTATHTSGVAAVAAELTNLFEFSEKECLLMEIAGYLHDLGKLAVPSEILEKPGSLGYDEINIMRKHTYYTYLVLSRIKGISDVAMWAAFHHERPSGDGYPFHIKGRDFTKLSRIMAVADIFTAITEDRPYRLGMSAAQAMSVLHGMTEKNAVDGGVVKMVESNFDYINGIRAKAQEKALCEYNDFTRLINAFV